MLFFVIDDEWNIVQGAPQIAKVGNGSPPGFQGPEGQEWLECGYTQPSSIRANVPSNSITEDVDCSLLVYGSTVTDDGGLEIKEASLLIDYLNGVAAASGVILDIDGDEVWVVEAYSENLPFLQLNQSTEPIAVQVLCSDGDAPSDSEFPDPVVDFDDPYLNLTNNDCDEEVSEDGLATRFSFDLAGTNELIRTIVIREVGNTGNGAGLGFDNFSPDSPAPEVEQEEEERESTSCCCNMASCGGCCGGIVNKSTESDVFKIVVLAFLGFIFVLLLVLVLRSERRQ